MAKDEYLKIIHGDKLSIDPDHTREARAFYAKFWGETLSDCITDYNGDIGHYRGETIISFNTVAGCMIRMLSIYRDDFEMPSTQDKKCQEKRLEIILEAEDVTDLMKCKFQRFYNVYHTLANFIPLVAAKRNINLNLIKNVKFHDFPDLFLDDLRLFFFAPDDCTIKKYFDDEINSRYINKFSKNWKTYIESNCLQDFFRDNSYSMPVQLSPQKVLMPYRKRYLNESEKDKCKVQICIFLTNAIDIIEKRAERLSQSSHSKISMRGS